MRTLEIVFLLILKQKTMAFMRVSGKENIEWYTRAASQAFTNGALAYFNGSGAIIPADATSGDHIGVVVKKVASTDNDYATAVKIPVDVAGENDIFEVGCTSTALATLQALVGTYIDLTDSVTANVSASAKDALLVVGVVSTTKILVKIASRVNILRTATT